MNTIFLLFLLGVIYLTRNPLVRLIKKLRIESLNRKLDDIFDDSEDIYKKYKIKYINHGIGFTRKEKKHNDWVDEVLNKEQEKNYEETGIKETDSERQKREEKKKRNIQRKKKSEQRLKQLIEKYGSEKGELIHKGKVDLGMTTEMVIDSKGKPKEVIEKVSSGKKREEYFYGRYKNRLGKYSYKFRVVLINGKVDGWNDIKN